MVLPLGAALALGACAQGAPEATGTLPPLPSGTPSPARSPQEPSPGTSSPQPDPDPAGAEGEPAPPAPTPTPTPTATPTAPVPEGLSPEQLEVAAFVEEYWRTQTLAIDERDSSLVRRLQTDECACRAAADLIARVADEGGARSGGEISVVDFVNVFVEPDGTYAQVVYEDVQAAGVITFADNSVSNIPREAGTSVMELVQEADDWRVAGVFNQ